MRARAAATRCGELVLGGLNAVELKEEAKEDGVEGRPEHEKRCGTYAELGEVWRKGRKPRGCENYAMRH